MAGAAKGTTITLGGTAVGEVTSISGLALSADTIETTNLLSTDGYREFIQGWRDGGEVSISGFFSNSDAGQAAFLTALNSGTSTATVITFPSPNAATWTCNGIVTAYETGAELEDAVSWDATLKVTGKPVLGTTASTGLTTPFFAISNSAVITPAADGAVYDYVATVLTGVSSVTITPTATAGVITVNGNTVATGVASSAIALGGAGSVTTATIVVTETSKTPKTYTIRIARGV
jgi:predicted secreted protein